MALVVCCDRCGAARCQVVKVLGADLCNACIADFHLWVADGPRKRTSTRPARRDWLGAIRAVAAEHGHVTPTLLAKHERTDRERAHWQCNYHVRIGRLVRSGTAVYALAQPRLALGSEAAQ